MKKMLLCLLAVMLLAVPATADEINLEGTVVATRTTAVLAPAAGVVQDVLVQAGETVTAGDKIAALMGTITYAEISGTVRVYGEVGENAETVTNRHGAVVYIEPDVRYTISASTRKAYEELDNMIIKLGETVYIRSTESSKRTGTGKVTAVNGSDYTVEVTKGNFEVSDSVYIFRNKNYEAKSRIGKGTATYSYPVAYTATGSVAQVFVKNGAKVTKGTPLFSTVEAAAAYSNGISATVGGTVAGISVEPGTAVEAGALIATIYPADSIRLEILADEIDLRNITVGQNVTLTFANGVTAQGQVERISGVQYVTETVEGEEVDDTAYFPVYVTFATDAPIACGMTAKVTSAE